MDRAFLDYWCEKGILFLTTALLLFAALAMGAVEPTAWLIVQVLTGGIVLLWIPRLWLREGHRLLFPPFAWMVLAFTGYVVWQSTQAAVEYTARMELLRVGVYAVMFFAILDNLNRQEGMQPMIFSLLVVGVVVSGYAVFQFITDSPYVWHLVKPAGYAHRGSGSFICPNHLAGFLEMLVPLSLAYVTTSRVKHTGKVFLGYAALAMLAGIAVTVSRGGWIATGAALLVLFLMLLRNRTYRIPALVAVVVIGAAIALFARRASEPGRRFERIVAESRVAEVRFQLWQPAIRIWQEHFWWGGGPGHFDHRFRKHRPENIQMRPLYVHNDYLNVLADYGTAGGALIGVALLALAAGTLKTWKFVQRTNDLATKPSNRAAVVLGSAIGLVALAVHSVVDFNLNIPANALVAVTLMAFLTGHMRFATERFWFNPGGVGRVAATLLLSGLLLWLARETTTGARQLWVHRQAARAPTTSAKLELLKAAHAIDPRNFELASEIGEILRISSFQGLDGYEAHAREAMVWFERAMQLNPLDPFNHARFGLCLDWLGEPAQAAPYFERALELDPNSYYVVALRGLHSFLNRDFAGAKPWFERAQRLSWWRLDAPVRDDFPALYLRLIEQRLKEAVPAGQ